MSSFVYEEPPQPYNLENLSVLIVEDSYSMLDLMSSMLKAFGVGEIMVCTSAAEARELITLTQARYQSKHATGIDVVLTDWLMPRESGLNLIQWIRSHREDSIKFMPIILVSGYTSEAVLEQARDNGANEALVKPLSSKTLAQRICNVIDYPRPFVESPTYFGPDRRRHEEPYQGVERRITTQDEFKVYNEQI